MIRLIGSTFYHEEETKKKLVKFIMESEKLSFGPQCLEFERSFARWQKRDDAVFVTSGSGANQILIQALLNLGRLKKGDRVGFSSVTWSTNVMPLIALGLVPIPMDISLETLNTPSQEVERVIRKHKVKALFITNLLGFSDGLPTIRRLCKKNNVILIEDNCESLGSVEGSTKLGNFGLASTFSFFVGHHLSTIEGGMVATDDKELASMLRMVRTHGWDRQLPAKEQAKLRAKHKIDPFYDLYAFYDLGYNFRPSEIQGFIGKETLRYADEMIAERVKSLKIFAAALQSRPDLYAPLRYEHMDTTSVFALPVICKSTKTKEKLIAACKDKIEIRPIVGGNMTMQPFYKKYFPDHAKKYPTPNATHAHTHGLYMPVHPDMKPKDKQLIVDTLLSI